MTYEVYVGYPACDEECCLVGADPDMWDAMFLLRDQGIGLVTAAPMFTIKYDDICEPMEFHASDIEEDSVIL